MPSTQLSFKKHKWYYRCFPWDRRTAVLFFFNTGKWNCPTLCDPMDWSPPGSSVHGILQARIQEWVAIPFSRGSFWPRDQIQVSCIAGRFFIVWATRETLEILGYLLIISWQRALPNFVSPRTHSAAKEACHWWYLSHLWYGSWVT